MSDTDRTYPKSVKAIYVVESGRKQSREGRTRSASKASSKPRISKNCRGLEREMRALFEAAGEYFNTYGKLHHASNGQKKDGSLKEFGNNTRKAHNAALKHLRKNSKLWTGLVAVPKAPKLPKTVKVPNIFRIGLFR